MTQYFFSFSSPVNFLDHTQHKALSVAVFGVLFCRLVGLVLSPNPVPFIRDAQNKGMGTKSWSGFIIFDNKTI